MRYDHWTSTWYARTDLDTDEIELQLAARIGTVYLSPIEVRP